VIRIVAKNQLRTESDFIRVRREQSNMQAVRKQVRFTYQDYLELPGEKRYELIDGDLHMVPAPLTFHQKVSRNLEMLLWNYVKDHDAGEILYAPVDVVLSNEDVVQPDILFISKSRLGILTDKNIQGAPDLVIEILSPTSKKWDQEIKKKLYEKHGVVEYWIVDPEARTIEVFRYTETGFRLVQTYPEISTLVSPLLPGLQIELKHVFP